MKASEILNELDRMAKSGKPWSGRSTEAIQKLMNQLPSKADSRNGMQTADGVFVARDTEAEITPKMIALALTTAIGA